MARPSGRRGYSARKRESRRSNSRASNIQIQGAEETRLYHIRSSRAPPLSLFHSFTDEISRIPIRFSYENGIQTFDTANVSSDR